MIFILPYPENKIEKLLKDAIIFEIMKIQ